MFISHFFLNATATTEIYTLSYTTLFRSRRGDVRHDPEREHGKAGERAAGEDAEQAEDRATAAVEVVVDRLRVDARSGNPRSQPVEREDGEREEDPLAKLGDAPRVGEPGEHLFLL